MQRHRLFGLFLLSRQLERKTLEGPTELTQGDKLVGNITSAALDPQCDSVLALGIMRRGNFEAGTAFECGEACGQVLSAAH